MTAKKKDETAEAIETVVEEEKEESKVEQSAPDEVDALLAAIPGWRHKKQINQ